MSSGLSISVELIYLMGWLLKNEKNMLNALVRQAIKRGFVGDLENFNENKVSLSSMQLYTILLDFVLFLEDSLMHNLANPKLMSQTKYGFGKALKKLDNAGFDHNAMCLNMREIASALSQEQPIGKGENVQRALFEQLLKRWDPSQNEPMN